MHSQLYKGCTRREGVLNVLGETNPVTRRMNNSARRRKLGSKRRSLEGLLQELETLKAAMPAATYTDAGCRAAGAGVPVPKTSQRLQKHETQKETNKKSPRPEPDLFPEEPYVCDLSRRITFLGPRQSPALSRRSSVSQRLESATPFVSLVQSPRDTQSSVLP